MLYQTLHSQHALTIAYCTVCLLDDQQFNKVEIVDYSSSLTVYIVTPLYALVHYFSKGVLPPGLSGLLFLFLSLQQIATIIMTSSRMTALKTATAMMSPIIHQFFVVGSCGQKKFPTLLIPYGGG